MTHISNWQKKYSATYLGLVPIFEERPGYVFSPSILDVDITDHLSPGLDCTLVELLQAFS